MAKPITVPRINNNDDLVRFSHIFSPAGSSVRKGDPLADVETDKATFTIEAEEDGYILGFVQPLGEMVPVGSVLAWLGSSPNDPIPSAGNTGTGDTLREPTIKAALLLSKFRLSADEVPARGERLTATDVLAYIEEKKLPDAAASSSLNRETTDDLLAPGESVALSVSERAMMKHTLWHRDSAVAAYLEVQYDTRAWESYAKAFQAEHNLLLSPLLPLMAWRLARLAADRPVLNCTISADRRHQYSTVNLGFTLQSETKLALLCVTDAAALSNKDFVDRLTSLMRRGMMNRLTADDVSQVTVSFSSMSRWQVLRHVPVLPPYTSLIVAHAQSSSEAGILGATYDHRVLTGGDVAALLRSLSEPPK